MDEKLTALLRHLPALRATGVTYLEVDGLKVLIDREPTLETGGPEKPSSPYDDPTTYGLPPGTQMPPSLRSRMGGSNGGGQ